MAIKTAAVIGSGTMGNGIAQVFAQSGYNVIMVDISDDFLQRGMATITKNLDRMVKKEKISDADKTAALGRIKTTTSYDDLKDVDFAVEAAVESIDLKKKIFQQLDKICRQDIVLATNTSSIPITEIGATTSRPEKIIGMHFMNPVPMMKLVEVIRGLVTSDETYELTKELSLSLGKTPVEVNDYPGFVANRILLPMINEAVYCLMEGVAEKEAIDDIMKLGMNHPMGPLALADLIGLDVCLFIMEVLHEGLGDSKYRPCPLLRKMVQAGHLGRKTKRGFYNYE